MLTPTNNDMAVPPVDIQFIELVGTGGYGEVWRGRWMGKGGGIIVAIKKITVNKVNLRVQKEVLMEVDILTKFRHPNVLTIYGACFFEQRELWIVMEYMEGGSLYEWLHSDLEVAWSVRLRLAQQAALGINVLHSSVPSVLHRDIKSLNFMVSLDGNMLKLIDFGMSKVTSVASRNLSTTPRESIGTIRWGAPETFNYPPMWTPQADIYSLGITFYEIASRKIPFTDVTDNERVIYVVRKLKLRPQLPPECPPGFAKLIRECWDDDPGLRPTSLQLLQKLEAVIEAYSPDPPMSHSDTAETVAIPPDPPSTLSITTAATIHPANTSTISSITSSKTPSTPSTPSTTPSATPSTTPPPPTYVAPTPITPPTPSSTSVAPTPIASPSPSSTSALAIKGRHPNLSKPPNLARSGEVQPSHTMTKAEFIMVSLVTVVVFAGVGLAYVGKGLIKSAELAPVGGLVYHFVKEVVRGNFHITNNHGLLAPVVIGVVGGCYLLGMIRVGFFLAGSAAGAAITSMVFSVIGDYLGSFANTIQLVVLVVLTLVCGAAVEGREKRLMLLINIVGASYLAYNGVDYWENSGRYPQVTYGIKEEAL